MKKASTTKAAQITVSLSRDDLETLIYNLLNCVSDDMLGVDCDELEPAEIISAWKAHRGDYVKLATSHLSKADALSARDAHDSDVALAEKLLAQLPEDMTEISLNGEDMEVPTRVWDGAQKLAAKRGMTMDDFMNDVFRRHLAARGKLA